MKIPSNKQFFSGKELQYISEAIDSGDIGSDGRFTRECARLLEQRYLIPRVLMTPSCTSALEIAAMLCELKPGDEVILPAFTFVSTANPIIRLGARPVFVDIREDTLNIDERLIEPVVTSRTKAIFPVHYGGIGCDMDRIMAVARKYNLIVVEDAAQGLGAFYKGYALGSIGHLGAFSFHHTKNQTCGEGGALCINSPELLSRAEIIRDKGTNRSRYLRGEIDKYTWLDSGSSHVPSELSCAFLYAQLEMLDLIRHRREEVFHFYDRHLHRFAAEGLLRLPSTPEGCESNYHIYYVMLPDRTTRDALMAHLNRCGTAAASHYVPLHSSPMGQTFGYRAGDLPVTEEMSGRLLRLPAYPDLREQEQIQVVKQLSEFFGRATVTTPGSELELARA